MGCAVFKVASSSSRISWCGHCSSFYRYCILIDIFACDSDSTLAAAAEVLENASALRDPGLSLSLALDNISIDARLGAVLVVGKGSEAEVGLVISNLAPGFWKEVSQE